MPAMSLTVLDLARSLPGAELMGDGSVHVGEIAYDSRSVVPGALFACWRGQHHDGHAFAHEAVRKGAAALLCERYLPMLGHVPQIVVSDTRKALGPLSAFFFGEPSRALRLVGVTGTNGKTTTTYLIKGVLDAGGGKSGLIGTIENLVGDERVPSTRTTPEAPDIQRLLARMVQQGCTSCAMEVSSHGIALDRIAGCSFSVGVYTNLSQDHLDYHETLEAYLATKLRLFERLQTAAVLNADDPYSERFAAISSAPVLRYGIERASVDYRAERLRIGPEGVTYLAKTPVGSGEVRLRLTGRFNVYNSLAAMASAGALGIAFDRIVEGLATVQVPGRFERVSDGYPVSVIVDYAHTPDGLQNVLTTARALTQGRLIVLFGAGGDRDRTKRPMMGKVAAQLADYAVITSDNPRSESPERICAEIEEGVREGRGSFIRIVDRREAIRHVVWEAQPGDLVLIAGKGHETYQEIAGRREHFDDREEARAALEERFGNAAFHPR